MTEQPLDKAAKLSWGLKQSFRAYVEGAGGAIETGEGARRSADGSFAFPAAPGEGLRLGADGKPEGVGRFVGEVRCEAHGGMLKVFLADPSVEIGPAGAIVAVADTRARDRRVELARLDLATATIADDGAWVIPAKLSRDGWQVLGDHYPPSTPLDPVRLKLAPR
ncbi:MAG TPA: HtaA domain-containing protein [Caulobacteraceae bacterium]|nr:HtaA domain-containing protein [Caulobacteraceae bacterium]